MVTMLSYSPPRFKDNERPENAGPNWKPFPEPSIYETNVWSTPTQSFSPSLTSLPPIADRLDFTFEELRQCSLAFNERHDCAVIATCVVTGYAYPRIHEMYRLVGRRARCRTPWAYMIGVFAQCGYKLQEITKFYESSSLRTIVPQLPNKGNFLVNTSSHVSAIRDGIIHDWAEQRKLYVQHIFQVSDLDAPPILQPPPKRQRTVVIDYQQPTKAVHTIADILFSEENSFPTPNRRYWSTFRAKVVAECVANGINKTTAAVQVGKWMKNNCFDFSVMS